MMTEDEAKTKWCPFSRVSNANHGGDACNRWDSSGGAKNYGPAGSNCIASACMAWRSEGAMAWLKSGNRPLRSDEIARSDDIEGRPSNRGHCGLAGRP